VAESWTSQARCRQDGGVDPEVPFGQHDSAEVRKFIEGFCWKCPVAEECLRMALVAEDGGSARGRFGVFGGFTGPERGRLFRLGTRRCVACGVPFVPYNSRQVRCGRHLRHGRPAGGCGSEAGVSRHRRRGEPVCGPCREARNAADRERQMLRRRGAA
jgi:hypothetical protein